MAVYQRNGARLGADSHFPALAVWIWQRSGRTEGAGRSSGPQRPL